VSTRLQQEPALSASALPKKELEEGTIFAPRFDAAGLIPAIVTDTGTGGVLMFAYMNEEALRLTLETGEAHFWSRSRAALWKKGETSGNVLRVTELRTDCDQDVLWLRARLEGAAACHTGRHSCFYRVIVMGQDGVPALEWAPDGVNG
jgi:phosphoribosyl-AMP cyclohydrolase